MKFGRLFNADILDVADRSRQELQRSFDRLLVAAAPPGSGALDWFEHLTSRPLASGRGSKSVSDRRGLRSNPATATQVPEASGPFFVGPADARIPEYFAEVLPDARGAVLHAADGICERRFSLLGHRALYLGDTPDWHRDAVSGKRAPLIHWSRLNPLDWDVVGDSKVTWELSRHQWLVGLAQAYSLTGDEAYAEAATAAMRDWMQPIAQARRLRR